MRIIAGEFKGRVIESPSGRTTRPTTDRVRESIFSAIYSRLPELEDASVLDAFAGSGALGIEALSRGASRCLFIERDKVARAVLDRNLKSLGLGAPRASVVNADSFDFASAGEGDSPFKLVLLDPPYAYEPSAIEELLAGLVQHGRLEDGCVIVYEHSLDNRATVAETFEADVPFEISAQKKYGKIGVTFLKYRNGEE